MATATAPRENIRTSGSFDPRELPIEQITVGSNVRADVGDVTELAESIKQHGILQPLRVEAGVDPLYLLKLGHRRLAAAKLAGLTHVPVLVDHPALGTDRAVQQLVENLQRRDLNPLEEARAFRGLLNLDPKLTQAELAKRIGRSAPYVSNALRILELDSAVLELVDKGTLSASHAKAIASLPAEQQIKLAGDVKSYGWSAHQTEQAAERIRRDAEWETERHTKAAKRAKSALGWLQKKKVPQDAILFCASDLHPTLRAAGYRNLRDTYGPGSNHFRLKEVKACDCVAYETSYRDGAWEQTCASMKHRRAFLADEKAADAARRKEGLAALSIGRQQLAGQIVDRIASSENVHRLLLWSVLRESYNWSNYARALSKRLLGKELTASSDTDLLWKMVADLPDDGAVLAELGAALAAKVLPDLTTGYGEYEGRSHQAVRRMVVEWLDVDAQLIDGKKSAKAKKGGK